MKNTPHGYMTTRKERISYWSFFIGQNIYYNITAAFISQIWPCRASPWRRWAWCC